MFHEVIDCADYGVPQHRQRLVLLASKHGPIEMIEPTVKPGFYKTVRDAIEELPPLKAGEIWLDDPLHQASELSPLNLKRVRASKAGGTWRDWDKRSCRRLSQEENRQNLPERLRKDGLGRTRAYYDHAIFRLRERSFRASSSKIARSHLAKARSFRASLRSYKFVAKGEPIYHQDDRPSHRKRRSGQARQSDREKHHTSHPQFGRAAGSAVA